MPVKRKNGDSDEFKAKVDAFKSGLKEMLPLVGEIARDEVVRATLAGIGAKDTPFAKYSPSYSELIAAVGGKSGGVVDLRGIFYKKGKAPKSKLGNRKTFKTENARALLRLEARKSKRLLRKGGGRQSFVRITLAGKSFFVKTPVTRPRSGLVDKNSEMSADLIKVIARGFTIKLRYTPRKFDYMIHHNNGTGTAPQREWFSVERANVVAAVEGAMKEAFNALIADFNS